MAIINTPITENIKKILSEIEKVLLTIDTEVVRNLALFLADNEKKRIVGIGAGRVGMQVKAFMMRLGHLGFDAWFLGDSTVPALRKNDILFVASGSGETRTIVDLVDIARQNEVMIVLVTGNVNSTMTALAHKIIEIKAPSKTKGVFGFTSIQPMTTLNEQCLGIYFDALVLMLMEKMEETHDTMWARHSNLE